MSDIIQNFKSFINQTEDFGRKANLNIPYKSGTKEYQKEYDRLMREKKGKERSAGQEESKTPKEPKVAEPKTDKTPKQEESKANRKAVEGLAEDIYKTIKKQVSPLLNVEYDSEDLSVSVDTYMPEFLKKIRDSLQKKAEKIGYSVELNYYKATPGEEARSSIWLEKRDKTQPIKEKKFSYLEKDRNMALYKNRNSLIKSTVEDAIKNLDLKNLYDEKYSEESIRRAKEEAVNIMSRVTDRIETGGYEGTETWNKNREKWEEMLEEKKRKTENYFFKGEGKKQTIAQLLFPEYVDNYNVGGMIRSKEFDGLSSENREILKNIDITFKDTSKSWKKIQLSKTSAPESQFLEGYYFPKMGGGFSIVRTKRPGERERAYIKAFGFKRHQKTKNDILETEETSLN